MLGTMATDRIRLVLLVDDELRAALKLEAARRREDMSDLAAEILEKALAGALAEVRGLPPKSRRGRKRKEEAE